jgi:hypothetical protein
MRYNPHRMFMYTLTCLCALVCYVCFMFPLTPSTD